MFLLQFGIRPHFICPFSEMAGNAGAGGLRGFLPA